MIFIFDAYRYRREGRVREVILPGLDQPIEEGDRETAAGNGIVEAQGDRVFGRGCSLGALAIAVGVMGHAWAAQHIMHILNEW